MNRETDVLEIARNNSCELFEQMEGFPLSERNPIPEQFLADELSWLLRKYQIDDYRQAVELKKAKAILRETKNGRAPVLLLNGCFKFSFQEIESAKETVAEYKRLVRLEKKLAGMGYYGAHSIC